MDDEDRDGILTYIGTLKILSQRAKEGNLQAAVQLARELRMRERESDEIGDLVEWIMASDD